MVRLVHKLKKKHKFCTFKNDLRSNGWINELKKFKLNKLALAFFKKKL